MLLPTTYNAVALTLVLLAMLWGVWANTLRADRKWRFELYAMDFAVGAVLAALALALTLGNSGSSNSFTFEDNLTVAGKRNIAYALGAGAIFGLGNILTLAGIALAGMSTALPVAAAAALTLTAVMQGPDKPAGLALAALVLAALAQRAAAAAVPVKKGMHPAWKGFLLSCVGGVTAALCFPVAEWSRQGEIGLGAYGVAVMITAGALLMTPLYNLFLLNLPVQGEALSMLAYFKGTRKQHALGLTGGAMWAGGAVAFYAAAGAGFAGAPKLLSIQAAGFGGGVLGALCGLAIWREQAGAPKAKAMLLGAVAALAAAVTLLYQGA